MGWRGLFWVLSGSAIIVLSGLMVALIMGMELDEFTAAGLIPRGILIKCADVFAILVAVAFLVFWTRLLLTWLNEKNKSLGRKRWMGRRRFFWILCGSAVIVSIWLMVALNMGMALDEFTAGHLIPPEILVKCAAIFATLVALGFLIFWTRPLLACLFIRIWRLLQWMFSWRMIRRYLYGLAIVALFYGEEDWRGKKEWEQYKAAAEASGERFDLSSFVSRPVPDDQNFAFAPIVAGRSLDIRIDSRPDWNLWPTNDFQGNWQCGRRVDLKAFQDYYRASATTSGGTGRLGNRGRRGMRFGVRTPELSPTNEFPMASEPQSPAADVLLALSKYDSAFEELRQASQRPFFQLPPKATNEFSEPNLEPLRECASVLRLRAVAELENGQSEKALEDVKLILYLAHLDRVERWRELWRKLWRMADINLAMQPLWQGLVDHKWSDTQLAQIEQQLAKFDFLSDYQYYVRTQRAADIREINSYEQGRFHEFWAQLYIGHDQDGRSLWQRIFNQETLFTFMPSGWFYQNQLVAARMSQQSLRTTAEVDQGILSANVARRGDETRWNTYRHPRPWNFVAFAYADFSREAQNFAFTQSFLDRALVACALERYRWAEGKYPPALDALAPRFMGKLPHDIINAQPLHYQRTDDNRFLLYSVGWNGTDDGGMIVLEKNKRYALLDRNNGDWVWPNPKE